MVDEAKLNELLGRMVGDLGAAASVALVRLGDSLGLYKALAKGPLTAAGLAAATGIAERYAREWLSAQAAADYVAYDKATGTFSLPPEQAMVFADEDSPAFMMGGFDTIAALMGTSLGAGRVQDRRRRNGRSGRLCVGAVARFFRPGYRTNLVDQWPPALVALSASLRRRHSGRCRLRPRPINRHDGAGVPQVAVHRLRLS
jgi:hypothetical protein